MALENQPVVGGVVEFADKAKFQLGLVVGIDEKTGKIRLVQSAGRELGIAPKQIQVVLPAKMPTSWTLSNIGSELRSIELRAKSMSEMLVQSGGVEDVWTVVDDGVEVTLEDLVGLYYDEQGAAQILAMMYALRTDRIYFKTVRPGVYLRHGAGVVEDLRRQEALKAQKHAWRRAFAEEAARVLAMEAGAREAAMEDTVLPNSDVRDAWQMVERYAVWGAESKDRAEAENLMQEVQNRLNRGFQGTAHIRARAFLREAGYWTPRTHVSMLKYDIVEAFPHDVEAAAFDVYRQPVPAARRDLTHLHVMSIDDEDTLDIDDAISIERLPEGGVRLGVHIAAPAASIPWNGALEKEARRRATSVYLPELRVPMMPKILSENGLSLMAGERRAAMTFFLTFDAGFNFVSSEITPSIIRSGHRLSYDVAERLLEEGDDVLGDDLRLIQELCEFSAENRHSHGAIDVDLPEYKLVYHSEDDTYDLHPIDGRMMSRQLVAECMILANAAAAGFCVKNHIPVLYRIQPPPVGLPSQETLDGMPNDYMRAYALRRCMQPAVNALQPGKHAGLGLEQYTQMTSPLRRYADLLGHYQLESWFQNGAPMFDAEHFNAVLSESERGLSNARSVSHEAYQIATFKYLRQLGAEPIDAIIVQYQADRGDVAQVTLLQTQVRANVATKTRFPPGTLCRVRIDNISPEDGTLLVKFVDLIETHPVRS